MGRIKGIVPAVVAVLALTLGACEAAGQTYAGGLFPESSLKSGDRPTVGITLEQRADRLAIWFDTTLRCGRQRYLLHASKVVPLAAGRATAAGHASVFPIDRRVHAPWKLIVVIGEDGATGTLDMRGTRRGRTACGHKLKRHFRAPVTHTPTGAAAFPPATALFLGLSSNRVGRGLRGPVLLRTLGNGKRVMARWSPFARCARGRPEVGINYTPPTMLRSDGSFSRSERFKLVLSDAVVRYRALFRGHFTTDGAEGELRLRARIYGPKGRRLITRCDTGLKSWSARGPIAGDQ